ncbi:hypothetical protein ADK64_40760 [Streptomyces sp. MMG1121]|nr:hypothetical protein ADK64_40760 [Streptomyces sp. MMG1121]
MHSDSSRLCCSRAHCPTTQGAVVSSPAHSALHGIRPMTETVPLDDVDTAYQKMLAGKARFRMVLVPS